MSHTASCVGSFLSRVGGYETLRESNWLGSESLRWSFEGYRLVMASGHTLCLMVHCDGKSVHYTLLLPPVMSKVPGNLEPKQVFLPSILYFGHSDRIIIFSFFLSLSPLSPPFPPSQGEYGKQFCLSIYSLNHDALSFQKQQSQAARDWTGPFDTVENKSSLLLSRLCQDFCHSDEKLTLERSLSWCSAPASTTRTRV